MAGSCGEYQGFDRTCGPVADRGGIFQRSDDGLCLRGQGGEGPAGRHHLGGHAGGGAAEEDCRTDPGMGILPADGPSAVALLRGTEVYVGEGA